MTETQDTLKNTGAQALAVRLLALAPLVVGGAFYLLHPPFRALLNEGVSLLVCGDLPGLRSWAGRLGPWAPLATTLLMVVQAVAAPVPAVLVTVTNSLLFGPFLGGLLSIVSATVAAALCFLLSRCFGEPLVARLLSPSALEQANAFLAAHGGTAVLVARLLPFVPFDPISYVAGLSRMRLSTFCWATLIGQIPAGMAYSYLGQEIDRPARLALWGAGAFLGLLILGWTFRRVLLGRRP